MASPPPNQPRVFQSASSWTSPESRTPAHLGFVPPAMSSSSQDSQPFHWHVSEFDDRGFEFRGRTLFLIVVIFSVLLLLAVLYLYARWVCQYRHLPYPHAPAPAPRPRGLDPSTIKSLPVILHRSLDAQNSREQAECCICLGVFEDGDKVKVLPLCSHCYHSECVDTWLSGHSSCPLCRASLRVDSPDDSAVPQVVVEWTHPVKTITSKTIS